MKKHVQRVIGLVLALAMIAAYLLVPSPMDIQAEAATVSSTTLCDYIQDGVTLHCWNWSIANIKANLGLIANMGYSSIQLSPMQELKEGTVNKPVNNWWAVYQPISFNINTSENHAVGTKDELIDLCNEAHKYDIKVIMDVVCNHTANNGANVLCPMVDPDLLNNSSCWHDYTTNSWDYSSRYNITQYCMAGLPDLNTGSQIVQDKALAMLKEYIDCGVDGFRFDAAKQIETPSDNSSFASDFWPTVINGASDYAASTRGIMLYNYGELLENPDNSGELPVSAYTQYMSVTESVWSNDVRYKLEANSAAALQMAYFKNCNADKMVLWAESHDTVGDGSSLYAESYDLDRAWALVASRAYAMSLYFPRANGMTNLDSSVNAQVPQEMGEIAKIGWNTDVTKAVNRFHNHFAGQSEYLTRDTTANMYYNERGNSGVILVNFNDGGRDINVPVYAMASGTYYDQITGNQFTVSGGRLYGSMGDTGIAVVYNPSTTSCSHSSHGLDGYCYDCYTYVGHKSGTTCSTCGTASTRTIYFKNTDGWSTPYIYGWHETAGGATASWPGTKMTLVEGDLYKAEIPATATNIIFNDNAGTQTANLVPSASDDTYSYDTSFWSTQGEVVTADNYYIFYTTSTDAYNGYDYPLVDGKVTMTFDETSYVWITDSNGVQYMTDGWQGTVNSATLYTLDNLTEPNKLYVPGGVAVTFTMVINADGTITLSYAEGGSTGGDSGDSGDSGTTGSDTMTVYFQNNWMWSDVCAYYWGGSSSSAEWPGDAVTLHGNDGTYDIYSIEVPTDITGLIINGVKNDGSGTRDQSPDITSGWYDGICYYMTWSDGNQVGSEDIDVILPPEDTTCTHSYTSQVTKAATCDTAGIKTYTCSKCGEAYTESIAAIGHSYSSQVTTAAGCTTSGVKTYTCANCSGSYTETIAATGHSYTSKVTTAATCTTDGVRTYTCSACSGSYTEVIGATGHSYSNGTCSVCGAADPNCSHSYTEKITTAATCTTPGVKTYTCSMCGDVYTVTFAATGHSYTSEVTTAATCTSNGVRTYTCGTCGDTYTEVIAATGHSYSNGKCTVCGTADPNCSHSYTSEVTTAATCLGTGLKTYTCSKCGDVYTEEIPANGHDYTLTVVAPTCENNGYTIHKCNNCTYSYNDTPVNPIGHNYSSVVTEPTCTESGYTTYTCANCGNVYTWNETAATGHYYEGGTCTTCGAEDETYAPDYYLVGNINGADYGCEDDWANLGIYKFENGQLVATFTEDSYVFVKTGDNVNWYLAESYCTDTTVTLIKDQSEKLYVPGNVEITFTLVKNSDGTLTLSYVEGEAAECKHVYSVATTTQATCTTDGVCTYTCVYCGYAYTEAIAATGHSYSNGACSTCGAADPDYVAPDYYLFGYINGADYGWNDDIDNLGEYKFVDGQLVATFTEDSYVAVKTSDNASFYMTNGYVGEATSATLYKFTDPTSTSANRLYVPGGMEITFTLTVNWDGNLIISYTVDASTCKHASHDTDGICATCGATVDHTYSLGVCTICGAQDPDYVAYEYYLFGYINGANYGCEEDYTNLGEYKFVDGELTVTFDVDSYIGVKEVNPGAKFGAEVVGWYMTQEYVSTTSGTFYNTDTGTAEKMLIPGGVEVKLTLTINDDGSLSVSYAPTTPVVAPTISLKYPTLLLEDVIKLNIYYTIDQDIDVAKMGLLTWTSAPSTVDISTADAVIPGAVYDSGVGYYGVTTEAIPAQYLGDTVYFCIYAQLADGSYAYGKQVSYSPTTYAYNQLKAASTTDAAKSLYVAILNYGAAAQTYLSYNTDALINASLTDEMKAYVNEYSSDMVHSVSAVSATKQGSLASNGGFSAKKPSISLDGAFAINYYFTPSATVSGEMTFYYWNADDFAAVDVLTTSNATGSATMTADSGVYGAAIEGIAAKDIDSALYACGVYTDANGNTYSTGILPYSLGVYCGNQAVNGTEKVQPLAAAIAVYGYYAAAFFG